MWNTPDGQVCFPSGAFASLLGHTILELTETLCQKRKTEYEWDLLNLFAVTRCIVGEGAIDDEYMGFNDRHCAMLDAVFTQLRVNIAREIDPFEMESEEAMRGNREEYFWRTKLYQAFQEVSAYDPDVIMNYDFYEEGDDDDDVDWDDMLEYLRITLARFPAGINDCFVDHTGEVSYPPLDRKFRYEDESEDEEDKKKSYQFGRILYYESLDERECSEEKPEPTVPPRLYETLFWQAGRDVECTRNALLDLCDNLIS